MTTFKNHVTTISFRWTPKGCGCSEHQWCYSHISKHLSSASFLEKVTKALKDGGFDVSDVRIESDGCDGMMVYEELVQDYDSKSW